ncbi:RidA family protein [Variovorax sp. H27-G14]|uniref:RidA family protein n=1 Tax=Variovorax sp. H27-G14 TaxID=3111914 RepID=UPI0038FCD531
MSAATPEQRLRAAGFVLPPAPTPKGNYAPACAVPLGDGRQWVHVSGQTCRIDGRALAGCCRDAHDMLAAAHAAEVAALNALSALASAAGGLSNVEQIVRVRGFVNAEAGFGRHSAVLDGASNVLGVAFDAHPPPARSAVGVSSLPDGAWVEIELEAVLRAG